MRSNQSVLWRIRGQPSRRRRGWHRLTKQSVSDDRIGQYYPDRNIIQVLRQFWPGRGGLVNVHDDRWCRIIFGGSQADSKHPWPAQQIVPVLFQHHTRMIDCLLWKVEWL